MCDICTTNPDKSEHFECPDMVDWPDEAWTPEQKRDEVHGWALFERRNPEAAEALRDDLMNPDCQHANHHTMVQTWRGIDILVKVCNSCGATVPATENLNNA